MQAIAQGVELVFEPSDLFGNQSRVTVAKAAELICDFSFEVNLLATSIRIALATSGKRFFEFFLETFQRVADHVGMQNSLL
jgi:hypothetical protein